MGSARLGDYSRAIFFKEANGLFHFFLSPFGFVRRPRLCASSSFFFVINKQTEWPTLRSSPTGVDGPLRRLFFFAFSGLHPSSNFGLDPATSVRMNIWDDNLPRECVTCQSENATGVDNGTIAMKKKRIYLYTQSYVSFVLH